MKFATPVRAFTLDGDGEKVGFFVGEAGDKDKIQVGSTVHALAYREGPYGDAGPNGTYCKV